MTVPENRSEVRRFRPMVAPRRTSSWLPPGARGVRLSDTPAISVVLASSAPRSELDTCLAQLRPQCREHGAELIVARACDETELENLQTANTDIRFVRLAVGTPLAHLRATGA